MMTMMYELWFSEKNHSYTYMPAGHRQASVLLEPDAINIWTYDAKSHFDAMRAYHEHMGWEPYKPESDWEDIVYD
jgi:hypothetical protein